VIGTSIAPADLGRLALAATCWGLGTVISKAALDEIAPAVLLPIQLTASVIVLVLVMRWRGVPLRGDAPAALGRLGILNPGVAYTLGLLGLATITASLAVLLWVLEPLLILVLATRFLGERLTPAIVVGSSAGLIGVAFVLYQPSAGNSELAGVALTFAGVICCAVYTILTRRLIPDARETSQVVVAQQAYSLAFVVVVAAIAVLVQGSDLLARPSWTAWAAAIASGLLYYAGAYWFYLGALKRVPASIAAASFYLIPVVGVAAAWLLLGERLEPYQWLGVVIVLASVIVVARQPQQAIDGPTVSARASSARS
jgi:drug/metabolite transporter (DMT)-like permease